MGSRVIFWVGEPPQKFFSKSEGVGEIMLFYFNFDLDNVNFHHLQHNPVEDESNGNDLILKQPHTLSEETTSQ